MKIFVVGTRNGKRVLHWPSLFALFAINMIIFTLSLQAVDWVWSVIFRDDRSGWWKTVGCAFWVSVVFLFLTVRRARSIPHETLPALDRRS